MKKGMMVLGIGLLIVSVALPVMAWGPGCWEYGRGSRGVAPEQRTKLDELYTKYDKETADLRNDIRAKSGELDQLLSQEEVDSGKVKSLQKEISGLKAKMADSRLEYELEARKIAPEGGTARGYGMGYGRRTGGYGPGACWN
jgi:zinc resistance-associated protein